MESCQGADDKHRSDSLFSYHGDTKIYPIMIMHNYNVSGQMIILQNINSCAVGRREVIRGTKAYVA